MNIVEPLSFTGRNRLNWKEAMVKHFHDLRFTHALTISWNRDTPLALAMDDLKALHGLVDRKLFGPRFHKRIATERTLAVFVFEGFGLGGHIHAHSLWRIRRREDLLPFARLFPKQRNGIWNRVVETGSYKLAINDDSSTFLSYALKGQHMNSEADEMIWSLDFLRP